MELRIEGRGLFHQTVGQILTRDERQTGNVVDGFFRVKLSALATGAIQNVDQMDFHIQKAQLKHREETNRPCPDDDDVCCDHFFSHSGTCSANTIEYVLFIRFHKIRCIYRSAFRQRQVETHIFCSQFALADGHTQHFCG